MKTQFSKTKLAAALFLAIAPVQGVFADISTVDITADSDNTGDGNIHLNSEGGGGGASMSLYDAEGNTINSAIVARGAEMQIDTTTMDINSSNVYISGSISNNAVGAAVTVSDDLSVTGSATVGSTLGVTGAATLSNTLSVAGATTLSDNLSVGGTATVTGAATLSSTLGVTGATTLNDTLGVTGAATLSSTLDVTGATTLNDTLDVTGAATMDSTLDVASDTSVGGDLTVAGNSTLGDGTDTTEVQGSLIVDYGNDGGNEVVVADGTVDVVATTSITGTTSINTMGAASTTVGTDGNFTSVLSSEINVGTGAYTTDVNIGNTEVATTVHAVAGNSSLALLDTQATMSTTGVASVQAVGGGSYSAYSAPQTVGTDYTLVKGDAKSQALVTGASVDNIIVGNTLVDGNVYINGTLTYSSNQLANTTVTSGTSELAGASVTTTGSMDIRNTGGASIDRNGALSTSGNSGASASLTLTNGYGNTHGVVVTESQTTMSGGLTSSSMTLADNGATFSSAATGQPIQVHGVDDGTRDFDAVNVRQFAGAIAGTAAMATIPQVPMGQNGTFGVGAGTYMGKSAIAAGMSYRFSEKGVIKVSTAVNNGQKSRPMIAIGAGWSW